MLAESERAALLLGIPRLLLGTRTRSYMYVLLATGYVSNGATHQIAPPRNFRSKTKMERMVGLSPRRFIGMAGCVS